MAAVNRIHAQDITVNDLPWKIEYDSASCIGCGACVATCTFGAISAAVV